MEIYSRKLLSSSYGDEIHKVSDARISVLTNATFLLLANYQNLSKLI